MNNVKPVKIGDLDEKSRMMLVSELANRSLLYIIWYGYKNRIIRFFGGTPIHRSDLYYKIKIKGDS